MVKVLSGSIVDCGGWVLSCSTDIAGKVNMLFEFERQACVEIYTVIIAAGVELGSLEHIRLTGFCQCTLGNPKEWGTEIASVDLQIQAIGWRITSPSKGEWFL